VRELGDREVVMKNFREEFNYPQVAEQAEYAPRPKIGSDPHGALPSALVPAVRFRSVEI
jgi:hypothetical protein